MNCPFCHKEMKEYNTKDKDIAGTWTYNDCVTCRFHLNNKDGSTQGCYLYVGKLPNAYKVRWQWQDKICTQIIDINGNNMSNQVILELPKLVIFTPQTALQQIKFYLLYS